MNQSKKSKFISNKTLSVYATLPIVGLAYFLVLYILINILGITVNIYLQIILFFIIPVFFTVLYIKNFYLTIIRLKYTSQGMSNKTINKNPLNLLNSSTQINKVKESIEREYRDRLQTKQANINALQSQINPHFLYNTLDSIRGKALMQNQDEIANMTEALSRFFRYSISKKGNIVSLLDEIKNIDTYIDIQKFRFGNKFDVIKILDDVDMDNIAIPKLTLQPIVENAIYHGIEMSEKTGRIIIRLTLTDARLIIRVSDNGVGIDEKALVELNESLKSFDRKDINPNENVKHGIAIKNVNERIKLHFGNQYGVYIYSVKDLGTDVDIIIPVEKPKRDFFTGDITI